MVFGLDFVAVAGGEFLMGSPESEPERHKDEGPQHLVKVPAFCMGKYPVTQAQWRTVATTLPQVQLELDPDPSYFKGDDRPVERVSWHEAVEFCERVSAYTKCNYRLPTEAEWEYACKAGSTTPFCFGEKLMPELANYDFGEDYEAQTTDVGSFPPNAFGLHDMHGNVWEWCADDWHDNYQNNPPVDGKVRRGGSWINNPRSCRSACRDSSNPDGRYINVGFRIVTC